MNYTHYLHDADEGFNWDDLPHRFTYVAPNAFEKGYVRTFLTNERSHRGTNSLFQSQDVRAEGSQNRLHFYGTDEAYDNKIFTRRWLFYPNLNNILAGRYCDCSIAGLMESINGQVGGISLPPRIQNDGEKLVWVLPGLDYSAGTKWDEWLMYQYINSNIPVPIESWFKLDYYVERHETNGKILMWVDDALVFNISGVCTKKHSNEWHMKISDIDTYETEYYGGLNLPFYQWVDDVEIWNGIPTPISPFNILIKSLPFLVGFGLILKKRRG